MRHKLTAVMWILMLTALLALPALERLPNGQSLAQSPQTQDPARELAMASALPVLSISTAQGEWPGEEDMNATLAIFQRNGGYVQQTNARIEIKERGNTSRRFPKKSYRVKIVDAEGKKENLSIAGLRSDDDWILNPMYADTSKIREALAYALWEDVNSSSAFAASSRVAYAEVFINGEYWGLYGVQERIDRKQVSGDKQSGILYKVVANDRPGVQELLACPSDTVCRGFELEFAGSGVSAPWEPAAAYMALLNGEQSDVRALLSFENTIDYGLWAMLCQAHDCHFKNQFLNCVYSGSGYMMYKIPWDLNNTFGDVWSGEAKATNYTEYRVGKLVVDGAFGVLLESGDAQVYAAIKRRWAQLRRTKITEEALLEKARSLYASIEPALVRDSQRWPEGGMGNGNAANIRDIESYIRTILPRMDEFIGGLGAQQ